MQLLSEGRFLVHSWDLGSRLRKLGRSTQNTFNGGCLKSQSRPRVSRPTPEKASANAGAQIFEPEFCGKMRFLHVLARKGHSLSLTPTPKTLKGCLARSCKGEDQRRDLCPGEGGLQQLPVRLRAAIKNSESSRTVELVQLVQSWIIMDIPPRSLSFPPSILVSCEGP